jgi:hypothetical protein
MTRKQAIAASPIHYAKRYTQERGVTLYATSGATFADIGGLLTQTVHGDSATATDWEPVQALASNG